ncbi:tRNA A64-2'-O-ribosylphosphate transferase [Syncephalis plumigaleata]|nr:tRNA A64-2'-O-ribosylphosphate transferase [Syncephalis plumigaleata]
MQSFRQVNEDIRKIHRSIYHRLHSINYDIKFITELVELFPTLPVIANERCGSWYVPPHKKAASAYFKSTDGHHGEWCFSLRRANLHILPMIAQHQGCLIVDSTRGGKRIPDALSKTIPIWCATINQVIFAPQLQQDTSHNTPNNTSVDEISNDTLREHCIFYSTIMITRSEHDQINQRIPGFVNRLSAAGIDLLQLREIIRKPLRPIWLTPQSRLWLNDPPTYDDAPFYPIICVTASEAVVNGTIIATTNVTNHVYIQGAADDAELWSMGLDASLFWQHKDTLLNAPTPQACEHNSNSSNSDDNESSTSNQPLFHFIGKTLLAIGSRRSNHLNGKKGQSQLLAALPKALDFVESQIRRGNNRRILVHCAKGQDRSVGVALAILVKYINEDGLLSVDNPVSTQQSVNKTMVQHQLLNIAQYRPQISPSRATINKVHSVLLDRRQSIDIHR